MEKKHLASVAAVLGLVSLVLLAGAIKNIEFQPAELFGSPAKIGPIQIGYLGTIIEEAADVPFWKQLAFWGILFVVVLLVASVLRPELRKKLVLMFIRLAISTLVILYLVKNNPELFGGILDQLTLADRPADNAQTTGLPVPVFQPPQVSGWFSYAVALGLVLLVAVLIWWLNLQWRRIKELTTSRKPLDELARIARESLQELKSGGNFENAIVECYARMSSTLEKKRGLYRETAMTPREFAVCLSRAGLPREPVEKLTRLFEAARYGSQRAGQTEIDEAVSSLNSIMQYCGERP